VNKKERKKITQCTESMYEDLSALYFAWSRINYICIELVGLRLSAFNPDDNVTTALCDGSRAEATSSGGNEEKDFRLPPRC
jgi:hypothetical protein